MVLPRDFHGTGLGMMYIGWRSLPSSASKTVLHLYLEKLILLYPVSARAAYGTHKLETLEMEKKL